MSSAESNSTSGFPLVRMIQAGIFRNAAEAIDSGSAASSYACLVLCDEARAARHIGCAESRWFSDTFRPQEYVDDRKDVGRSAFFSCCFDIDDLFSSEAADARCRVIALLFAAAIAEGGGL